ncbi:hypothetical protein [Acaryochloris marina]|uniref:Uncharacterized protein n=1 Tax=Acaryochloris marina (strain MBIC 11017) TaxID=329726 RepID=B0C1V0_ACAM1|nr:hypothetical protein [Acaryochloris marina]ABW26116.1 hypothetical protein AM1_1077 [Acaryochloris marina MBIC11017]BDM80955.1 hypothetical protein AM10699_38220 [Acaryochloris marina MBIC10699]
MFEEVSSNPTLGTDESQQSSVLPTSHASMGADELMDELFHDLEVGLDDSSFALATRGDEHVGYALLETGEQNSSDRPGDDLLVPYTPLDSTLALREDLEASLSLDLVSSQNSDKNQLTGKRLLMTSACVSLVGISMFWVGRQLRLQHAPVAAAPRSAIALPQVPSETVAFADYVSQSLERIHQETKAAKLAAAKARTQPKPVATLPSAGLPSLPNVPKVSVASSTTASIPNNVERVYVPVTEAPAPVAAPKPASTPVIAAAKATTQEDELPVVKPLPLTPPSNGERKFLGGTNLGDQPVFMVSINGSTRHIKLGESIDETGATFVEFDGEQSVLKQGNQLRSVTAGQSF